MDSEKFISVSWEDVKEAATGVTDEEKIRTMAQIREKCKEKDIEGKALAILIRGSNEESAEFDRKRLESYGITEGMQIRLRGILEAKEYQMTILEVKKEGEIYSIHDEVQIVTGDIEVKQEDETLNKWIPAKCKVEGCGQTFPDTTHLNQHQTKTHRECLSCKKEFIEGETAADHASQCPGSLNQDLSQNIKLEYDQEVKPTIEKKKRRRRRSKTPIPVITEAENVEAKLLEAMRTVEGWKKKAGCKGEIICSICAEVFINPHRLRNHMREVHLAGRDRRGPSPVWEHFGKFNQGKKKGGQCKYCKKKFLIAQSSTTALLNHLKTDHKAVMENQRLNSNREWPLRMLVSKHEGRTYCLICAHAEQNGKITESGGAMRRHFVSKHSEDESVQMILKATQRPNAKSRSS